MRTKNRPTVDVSDDLTLEDLLREQARRDWRRYVEWRGFRHMAPRHVRVWEWFASLANHQDTVPNDLVECWARGGAKSSTIEEAVAWLGGRAVPMRRFVLYVSATQEQADNHVQAVATNLVRLGAAPAVGKTGSIKGWRRNQIRTADGFNVAALGLDTGARGIKLDEFRPDLIVLDDIDEREDTTHVVAKKKRTVTQTILPAGGANCPVVFVQNMIHAGGLMAELYGDECDWLMNRICGPIEPAVQGLAVELRDNGDGRNQYVITSGAATWEGQDLATCQRQINLWGLESFMRESQHEVADQGGRFFITERLNYVDLADLPAFVDMGITCDIAATEGGGDWTVFLLYGWAENGNLYVIDVWRGQVETEGFYRALIGFRADAVDEFGDNIDHVLPVDPGAAGKHWTHQLTTFIRKTYGALVTVRRHAVRFKKAKRARRLQAEVNAGNVFLVRGKWNKAFVAEMSKYSEDPKDYEHDDQIDAAADAVNDRHSRLAPKVRSVKRIR